MRGLQPGMNGDATQHGCTRLTSYARKAEVAQQMGLPGADATRHEIVRADRTRPGGHTGHSEDTGQPGDTRAVPAVAARRAPGPGVVDTAAEHVKVATDSLAEGSACLVDRGVVQQRMARIE